MTDIPQIECSFLNVASLYMAYMPFVKDGGLFIRTKQSQPFGSEVKLSLTLMGEQELYVVKGKVIWITPRGAQGEKLPGIGVQFISENKTVLTNTIEKHLAGMLNSTQLTDTI